MVEGWLFDLYVQSPGRMVVWLKTRNSVEKLVDSWYPSFYVAGERHDLDRLCSGLSVRRCFEEWYERVESTSKSQVLRVFYNDQKECERLKRVIIGLGGSEQKYRLYNLDVPRDQLYLYEKNLFPLAHVTTYASGKGVEWNVLDSVYDTAYSPPTFRSLGLEVEAVRTESPLSPRFNLPIGRISVQVDPENEESEIFTIDSGSEQDKLHDLLNLVHRLDPDVIVTTHGDSVQLPYLGWRARVNGLAGTFYLGREAKQRLPEKRKGQSYFSYGRVYYRSGPVRLLGRFHLDRENAFVFDDCGLQGIFEVSRSCRIPLHRASRSTIGTAMTSLQMFTAYQSGFLIPWRKDTPEDFKTARELLTADRGGFVYEPRTGLFDGVGELDFSSLYPMLMLSDNISPETVHCTCCPRSMSRVPELNWNICNRKTGIVPKSLKILLMKRQDYKRAAKEAMSKELKDLYKQRSDALKWILVCCLQYDSPVLISHDGRIGYQQIGRIIDEKIGDTVGVFDCPVDLYVAGVDKDLKAKFCRVSKLIKTNSPKKLLQVKMEDGRLVKCTFNHTFYILRNGHLVDIKAEKLSKGDLVPVAKHVLQNNTNDSKLDLLESVRNTIGRTEGSLWRAKSDSLRSLVTSSSNTLEIILKKENRDVQNLSAWRESGIVPFRYLDLLSPLKGSSELQIGRGRMSGGHIAWLPASVDLDEDLGFFLGFYVADGSAGENFIRLDVGGNESEIVDHLTEIIRRKFGLTPRVYKESKANMLVVQVNSVSLVQILNRVFDLPSSSSAGKLKVPNLVFNASKKAILGFISGLVAGDGSVNKDREHISIATHSYDFAVQIGYLALQAGLPFNIIKGKRLHRIYFVGPAGVGPFKKLFLKQAHRARFEKIETSCHSNCHHAIFEMLPVEATGLKEIATLARTVRTPRLEGRIRVCPERARRSIQRITTSSRFSQLQDAYSRIKKLLDSDVGFVAVKEVEQIEASSDYVYCFEISDDEAFPAFFTGSGGVLVHNSFGYLGFKNARFGKIDAHIAVCALSRDVLTQTTELVHENGYDLLHGIVDSTWLTPLGGDASPEGFEQVAKKLGNHFDLPISFEGVYRWIVFLPSKVYFNRPVLNRYYGIFSDGRLKIRGIALRRHDSPGIVTRLQSDALKVLGGARDADEFRELLPRVLKIFVDRHVDRVRSCNIPTDELVIRKNLSKDPPQYSHRVLQVVAAQQLRESGFEVLGGQTVGYVILKERLENAEKQVMAEELTNGKAEYDVESYVSLLVDGLAEILGPVGFEKEKLAGFAAQS